MPLKDQTWGMIVSFHADSIIKRILKAITFHAEATGDHCSNPDEFKLNRSRRKFKASFFFSFPAAVLKSIF